MADTTTTIAELKELVRHFAAERSWEKFHSPKNLAMGLAIETAELMEHFLWLEGPESRELRLDADRKAAVAEELSDVANHLLNLCNVLEIDLSDAFRQKILKNAAKYPVERYRGKFS